MNHPSPLKKTNLPDRRGKLTPEQRESLLARLKAGEKPGPLSLEYKISRQAVCQLRDYHLFPEVARRRGILRSRLLPDERENVIHLLRTTVPRDHGVEKEGYGHPDSWNTERLTALTRKLYDKKMFAYAARECIQEARPDPRFDPDAKPEPPGPPDVRDIDPELAQDEEFVEYYLSDACQHIRQKEYEWALREWEERQARKAQGADPDAHKRKRGRPRKNPLPTPSSSEDDHLPFDGSTPIPGIDNLLPRMPSAPGERRGKHAKSKGAPFSKPKRKKKR
ncbi:MAG: hypothetical protein ACNA8L_12845 [Luteolibacter sp.]|jgi:hypothetical protein